KNISSVAFPCLGCGNGGLKWEEEIKPIMEKYLSPLPMRVYIYVRPYQNSEPQTSAQSIKWLRENARDMSFSGVWEELRYNYTISPFEFSFEGTRWTAQWREETIVLHNCNEDAIIEHQKLHETWDDLRIMGIVKDFDADRNTRLAYSMLNALGYLNPVRVFNSQEGDKATGYQINKGFERVFSLNGNAEKKTA
ncbi:MAG: hypothetical protein IJP92_15970, partial [Lachnospiraceae bacterium]|nr:hypothetical protein [Lachnospiraceae bacterium]